MDIIRVLQKKCVRTITFSDFRSHSAPLFSSLKLLKVDDVVKLDVLNFVYDFRHNFLPDDLKSFYTACTDIHAHNNRLVSDSLFVTHSKSLKYGEKTLKHQGPSIWNDLIIRKTFFTEIHTKTRFKYKVKEYFLSTYV